MFSHNSVVNSSDENNSELASSSSVIFTNSPTQEVTDFEGKNVRNRYYSSYLKIPGTYRINEKPTGKSVFSSSLFSSALIPTIGPLHLPPFVRPLLSHLLISKDLCSTSRRAMLLSSYKVQYIFFK